MTLLQAFPTTTATPAALPTLLLSAIVWVPALSALALLFFPSRTELQRQRIRSFAIGVTALVLAFAVFMWYGFRDQSGTYAYEEARGWPAKARLSAIRSIAPSTRRLSTHPAVRLSGSSTHSAPKR